VDFLGLLLPQRCAGCSRHGVALCPPCRAGLRRLRRPLCARCGAPTAWPVDRCRECSGRRLAFATARAAVLYDRRARAFVTAWKERGIRVLAGAAAELVCEAIPVPAVEGLVFVPPDSERLLRRGHNPSRELALELGGRWRLPVADVLARGRRAGRQRGLSRAARRRNVAGAFRAKRGRLPRALCVVDDVYTTGATASAAATALRAAGAREIHVVTLARTVRRSPLA
jgi:predicted amidophosphoribosyltransferase